jgi:hypothetical protein
MASGEASASPVKPGPTHNAGLSTKLSISLNAHHTEQFFKWKLQLLMITCLSMSCTNCSSVYPFQRIVIIIIIIINGSTDLRRPWPSSEASAAEVSSYCFFTFRDKSLFQCGVVSPTPNPRLSWRADVFCQGRLP